jgi:ureidoacrylate peracid hydrolase
MHKVEIPAHIVESVVARRGTDHVYAGLDPARTALIVVDLQNGFMMPGVAHALCDTAREIVPNVNRIADAVRRTGGKVFWIKNTHDEGCLTSWSHFHEDLTRPERRPARIASMSAGTLGHELWADLVVRPEDEVVQKTRFSAFIQGSSDLESRLRAQGFDTLIITGTVTNVCCESTARDAMMLNFKTIMVTDGNAANSDAEHNASLIAFYLTFGDIMDTDMLVTCLEANARIAQAAE